MDAARYARVADDVELLALVRRETGKVRVGQGRVDDARAAFAEAREGLLAAGLEHETRRRRRRAGRVRSPGGRPGGSAGDHGGGDRHRDPDRARDRARRPALPPREPAAAAGAAPRRRAGVPARTGLTRRGRGRVRPGPQPARPQPGARGRRAPGRGEPPGRARDAARAGRGGPSSRLGPLGGVRTAQMVPLMSLKNRTTRRRSPALFALARHVVGAEVVLRVRLDDTLGRARGSTPPAGRPRRATTLAV